jgi:CHAT domain-containing protein/tetratricopeptide (TPR) repeat protein
LTPDAPLPPGAERAATLHAEGQAATANMRPLLGARLLRAALRHLDGHPDTAATRRLRGRVLVSLAYAEADQGHVDLGWRLFAEAEPLLPPDERGVLFSQRALLLTRTGRDEAAIAEYGVAIAVLREQSQPEVLARTLLNRGNLYLSGARVGLARADLRRCVQVATRHGFTRILPVATHSLAYLDYLAGDLPAALRTYHAVADEYAKVKPGLLPVLALDRARALTAAGLFGEADRELATALEQFGRHQLGQDYAEAQLARAETALLAGDPVAARAWARRARTRFLRRGNARWAALASLLALRADHSAGATRTLAGQARALARTLQGLGLAEDAQMAGLLAVRASVAAGQLARAERELVAIGPPRRSVRLDTRLLWRLTRAEVATATGRPAEASRQLGTGLSELQRYRSQLGCLDLQTGAAVHGSDLADAGLRAALADGSTREVYRWSERARAQAMLLPPVRPAEDPDAAAAIEELRQVRTALRAAEVTGHPTAALRARDAALRRTIREHAWFSAGPGTAAKPVPFGSVKAELADAAMVVYVHAGPALHALVVAGGSATLVPLGRFADAQEALLRLRADLDVQAGRAMPERLASAVRKATRRDASALAATIVDPLRKLVGDRDLVVIPTGILSTVPWAVLPGCAQRPVTVAPSASTWSAAQARLRTLVEAPDPPPALLVAGPGNNRGEAEVRAIAALRSHATVLTGPAATPAATLAGLTGAGVAHLAAHGHHEADNPLFSTLELTGGPLMGYDLERTGGTPPIVVLSSCDLGLSDVRPGDETLGMTTALLSAGSSTVIASVSRVADEAALPVMTSYHRSISQGRRPAAALAGAGSPDSVAGFVCFGAG